MSLLTGVSTATNAEQETDRLGGFKLLDSGVHPLTIELAYLHTANSGARALNVFAKSDAGSMRTIQYFTSGTAKGCKTYYEKDGKQHNLPGFTTVNDMFIAAGVDAGMDGAELETKVIKLYDKDAGGEVPTEVQMVMNLVGKTIAFGVLKQIVDKTENVAAEGEKADYQPTGETREENELNKVFTSEGYTIPELRAKAKAEAAGDSVAEPTFIHDWKDKYEGQVINKVKGGNGAASNGSAGAPKKKPTKLFS